MATKKIFLSGVLLSIFLLGNQGALASGNADSNVDVEFLLNTDTTKPIDPLNPDNIVKPNPLNPGTGNTGPLSIDYVSKIQFGKQKSYGDNYTYFANLDNVVNQDDSKKEVPNYVQITDNRGTNSGWSLSVKQSGFFKNNEGSTIEKAELTLLNSNLNSNNNVMLAPISNKSISLKLDAKGEGLNNSVVVADKDKGAGTWVNSFGKNSDEGKTSVALFIPGGTVIEKGLYSTTLIWTLSSDPAQ